MKKFQVFLGLVILVLALCAVDSPINADGAIIGGAIGDGCPCDIMKERVLSCGSRTGNPCSEEHEACAFTKDGSDHCTVGGGGAPHNCLSNYDCYNFKNDICK